MGDNKVPVLADDITHVANIDIQNIYIKITEKLSR